MIIGPPQTSKAESFAATVNGSKPLTTVAKFSTLDVCGGPAYTLICYYSKLTQILYVKRKTATEIKHTVAKFESYEQNQI